MNFKKITVCVLVLSLLATATGLLSSCDSSEPTETTQAAHTEAPTVPETQPAETEPDTDAIPDVECSFTVTDQDGTPIPSLTAYLTHKDGLLAQITVTTDENGKASCVLKEGTYSVTYENLPADHLQDDMTLTVAQGTTEYALKVMNNTPNGTESRPFPITNEITEVTIPANTSYTYRLHNAIDRTIYIENTTLKVSYKSVEYAPDENGTVDVLMTNESLRDPGYFTLINETNAEVTATLQIRSTPGSMNNPHAVENLGEDIVASVAKGSTVYYKWTATKTGVLMVTSHTPGNYIAMSNLANSAVSYFTSGSTATYLNVTAGDEIQISVATTKTDKDVAEITFMLTEHAATAEDSVPVWGGEYSFTLAAGATYAFATEETVAVTLLTVKGNGIQVSFNGEMYEPDEKGKVEIRVTGEAKNLAFTVENKNTERQEIDVSVEASA